jgi:hypothetical protein
MEKNLRKSVLVFLALPALVFPATIPIPRQEHDPVLIAIPTGDVLLHGRYRLSGRFQYFTIAEPGSSSTPFLDTTTAEKPKEIQSLNYSSELLFGIQNRAEIGVQYGQLLSLSVKTLMVREDLLWPDVVFGVRNLLGSQEGSLYGVTNTTAQKNLQSESYLTFAKSFPSKTRTHLGISVLTHATKGWGSVNAGVDQNLGGGASLGYEVFERYSDFHQVFSFQWRYRNLVGLSIGMTEFQSWIRQGGRWGFFLTPSHKLNDGYNSPGITVALQVLGWVPNRSKLTIPERVAILEVKSAELERQVEDVAELKRQVAELQAGALSMTMETDKGRDSILPSSWAMTPAEKALSYLHSMAEKMQSDIVDPKEVRERMAQLVEMGAPGVEVVKRVATDIAAGSLRVPAVLVMAYSMDTTYVKILKSLCSDADPQMRREALTALVKVDGRKAMEDAKRMLSDPDQAVALAAAEAYRQLSSEAARPGTKNGNGQKGNKIK